MKQVIDFHFNVSLRAVYLARFDWLSDKTRERIPFSMVNYKTFFNNALMLDQFIRRFAINTYSMKYKKRSKN